MIHQIRKAARIGAVLVLDGAVDDGVLVHIATPLVQAGITQLMDQAYEGGFAVTHPGDVTNPADRTSATLLAAAGPIFAPPEGPNLAVVDALVWPDCPTWVLSTANAGALPPWNAEIPSASQLMAYLHKVTVNHGALEDFEAAAVEAATICGATWLLTPQAPIAAQNIPYLVQAQPNNVDFDNLVELEADDPRYGGEDPWPAHPQAGLGLRWYTQNRVPVMMRAIPFYPTLEISAVIQLPEPGELPLCQLLLGLFNKGPTPITMDGLFLQKLSDFDLVMGLLGAYIASMAQSIVASFNLLGVDICALLLNSPDLATSLIRLSDSKEFKPAYRTPAGEYTAAFFQRLIASLEKCLGVAVPPTAFSSRAWANHGALTPNVEACCAYRHNYESQVPGFGNPLAVNDGLVLRPMEWGISAAPTTADFKSELQLYTLPHEEGLYTWSGTEQYMRAKAQDPRVCHFHYIPHAAICIQTALRAAAGILPLLGDIPLHETWVPMHAASARATEQVRVVADALPMIGNTGYLAPLVIKTFYHRAQQLAMPALIHPQLLATARHLWLGINGPVNAYIVLPLVPSIAATNVIDGFCYMPEYGDKSHKVDVSSAPVQSGHRSRSRTPRKTAKPKQAKSRSRSRSQGKPARRSQSRGSSKSRGSKKSAASSKSAKSPGSQRSKSGGRSRSRSKTKLLASVTLS